MAVRTGGARWIVASVGLVAFLAYARKFIFLGRTSELILAFSLVGLALALGALPGRGHYPDLFSPSRALTAAYLTYVLLWLYIVADHLPYSETPQVLTFGGICAVGLVGLHLGTTSTLARAVARATPPIRVSEHASLLQAAGLLAGLGLVLVAGLMAQAGGPRAYLDLDYSTGETLQFLQGRGYLAYGFTFLTTASLLILLVGARHKRLRARLLAYGLMICLFGIHLTLGRRFEILALGLLVLGVRHYTVKPLKLTTLLPVVLVVYLVGALYGSYRYYLDEGVGSLATALRRNASTEQLTLERTGEFKAVPDALWELIEHPIDLQYGATYIRGIQQWIPLALWAERPKPLDQVRLDLFHPEFRGGGGSLAFFTVAEGYWNFGVLGAGLQLYVLGFIAGLIYNYAWRHDDRLVGTAIYLGALPVLLKGFRNELMAVSKNLFLEFLLPLTVALILTKLLSRRQQAV